MCYVIVCPSVSTAGRQYKYGEGIRERMFLFAIQNMLEGRNTRLPLLLFQLKKLILYIFYDGSA